MAPPPAVSALGMALTGKSASVDIPKPRADFPVAPTAAAAAQQHGAMLPTPPNSISPNLVPHGHANDGRRASGLSKTDLIDSDVELKDAPDNPPPATLNTEALDSLGDLDSAGAITASMLARHHLPEILLAHGPLAIRHIMSYLTTSVPGFSRITSAKARRLVVAALEGKGAGTGAGQDAGREGDVVFDKVGWGRWDARVKGRPPRERRGSAITPPGSLPSSYSQGLQVPGQGSWRTGSENLGTSYTGNSAVFSHSEVEYEDQDMLEHEADKMSLDGDDDGYASSAAADPLDADLGDGDLTDDEDWASIGAEALRARSLPNTGRSVPGPGRLYQPIATYSYQPPRFRSKTPADMAHPLPIKEAPSTSAHPRILPHGASMDDSQERAAIEALLSLGST